MQQVSCQPLVWNVRCCGKAGCVPTNGWRPQRSANREGLRLRRAKTRPASLPLRVLAAAPLGRHRSAAMTPTRGRPLRFEAGATAPAPAYAAPVGVGRACGANGLWPPPASAGRSARPPFGWRATALGAAKGQLSRSCLGMRAVILCCLCLSRAVHCSASAPSQPSQAHHVPVTHVAYAT